MEVTRNSWNSLTKSKLNSDNEVETYRDNNARVQHHRETCPDQRISGSYYVLITSNCAQQQIKEFEWLRIVARGSLGRHVDDQETCDCQLTK